MSLNDNALARMRQFGLTGSINDLETAFWASNAVGVKTLTNAELATEDGVIGILYEVTDIAGRPLYRWNGVSMVMLATASDLQGTGLTATDAGFRGVPQNSQSVDYTLVASDSGKQILHPAADTNTRTFTIPANASVAFSIGTAITFINETSQVLSIAINSDTLTLANGTTTGTRSLAQNGVATAIKITSTKWIISGSGLT